MADVTAEHPELRLLRSHIWLRLGLGFCGFVLIGSILIWSWLGNNSDLKDSISAYYYTPMRDIFVGILCAIGAFLIGYIGEGEKLTKLSYPLSGAGAIGVALFPSESSFFIIHGVSAVILLGVFGVISIKLFPQLDLNQAVATRGKIIRNCFYVGLGITILVSVALFVVGIALRGLDIWWPTWLSNLRPIFWVETIAVLAFSLSWTIKGLAHAEWFETFRGTIGLSRARATT